MAASSIARRLSSSTPGEHPNLGRCAFVGEGGPISLPVSELLIHEQVTLHGSWATSLRHTEELLEHLVRWSLHPERIVTHRFTLDQADEAHRVGDRGAAHRASPWEVGSVHRIAPPAQPAHR
ncbi:hypothetical protein SAMN05660657_01750 [Geodermatophilus amargosae]|uniref:Zinc-binding dehydrogenase n=1 Tax=Geodermatophilus amargosae TaxID=1296565 RepID=A0A1I6Z6J9_9ACTN|nr:hypothetical protein [Geodermatophilus amargosae]SFT58332.1 hypothetical protein SAMN05660657_01750 [Geodermatophilus amargosae]